MKAEHEQWSKNYEKIHSVFIDDVSLFNKLNEDVPLYTKLYLSTPMYRMVDHLSAKREEDTKLKELIDHFPSEIVKIYDEMLLEELPADHSDIALIINNIGLVYREKANYSTAINYFNDALKYFLANLSYIAQIYGNIRTLYSEKGDNSLAFENYER
ncbi:unnamed protein product [Didymodactylos carnosus]|uniref:Tetratricopeptide repeat protein n=1 Tax=Didymodactylos carnosus TaxID=1234261 RepID=A0A814F767_9BILA|nr:unnamed protein product [Didymodactylos carnosus]CAF1124424.1 unnamed protein product [Didymodactylos carnosus]CAF3753719.1 unnamed protein product [Didymodactylos carnosus]CAF3900829.1 unnamed protein product [Didymodactylos carnosus]